MPNEANMSAMTADMEESDARDHRLPQELENRDEDVAEVPDEVDLPDPNLEDGQ